MIFGFIFIAIVIGALMPIQAGLNAELSRYLRHPYLGAFLSLSVGALAISVLLVLSGGLGGLKRIPETPPHLLLGGILSALFVSSSMLLIPKLGATGMVGSFITGQLLGSIIIDHFGFLGLNQHPMNLTRLIGVFLLFVGLFLVIRKAS
jgi:transporter family-2 protein